MAKLNKNDHKVFDCVVKAAKVLTAAIVAGVTVGVFDFINKNKDKDKSDDEKQKKDDNKA